MTTIQIPSIILPQVWSIGTERETIGDLVTHVSIDIPVEYLQDKMVQVMALEFVTVGAPGNLQAWIEVSPVPSSTSTLYWAAIGGGGGLLPPVVPTVIVGVGMIMVHSFFMAWDVHSPYARLVVQTPVNAGLATGDLWLVQAVLSGKK